MKSHSLASPAALLPLVFLIGACAPETSPQQSQQAAAEAGEEIFTEQCGVCHGATGRGPALAELQALSREELGNAIRNHPTTGEWLDRMTADELSKVVDYLEE